MAQLIEESSYAGRKDFLYNAHGKHYEVEGENVGAKKSYLVTGGTSFTAKYLLERLVARPDTHIIHCVALRDKPRDNGLFTSPKVVYHPGNFSAPLLGLSQDAFGALATEVDVIVHLGAVRGYFDNYHLLRSSNVHPTRELVRLAAPRRVPIHYISTAGVLPRDVVASNSTAGSAATYVPAVDGNDGYAASKWASERILKRSAAKLGVPASIYRFVPSGGRGGGARIDSGKEEETEARKQALLAELGGAGQRVGMIPDMEGWTGRVDFGPGEHVAAWLHEAIVGGERGPQQTQPQAAVAAATCTFAHYENPISVDAEEVRAALDGRKRGSYGRSPRAHAGVEVVWTH